MPRKSTEKWVVMALAALIPLAYAAFADHAWEDYFITLRSSRNLVEGHGLVFNPGDRLHTFTSPLGVLVPALCTAIAGVGHESLALWLFRLIDAAVLAAGAGLVWDRLESLKVGALGRLLVFGLLVTDCKLTEFSTSGMETAFLIFFVQLLWCEMESSAGPRLLPIALAAAGLQWTRPDGFILGGAIIAPHVIFRKSATEPVFRGWGKVFLGLLLGVVLYLPWIGWAWWYYGTPVPHTITAKSQFTATVHASDLVWLPWRSLTGQSMLMDLYLPIYWVYGGWPAFVAWFARIVGVISAFAWLVPGLSRPARRTSLAVFLGSFYFCSIILFPWYSPPWTVLGILALGLVTDSAGQFISRQKLAWLASLLRVAVGLGIGAYVFMLAGTAWEMREQQRIIENQGRRDIGLWLAKNASAHDTVFLEPLGYIGYYSQLKMYDFPGLSSREVVAAIRGGSVRFAEVINRLRPTWLVLRPFEIADPSKPENAVLREYRLVKVWNQQTQLDQVTWLPGRGWIEHDAQFLLFRHEPTTQH
ncbi:MAG TPA: hypothetical protein VHD32_07885 [Candidatus Didemnitutus sp.]|nr:hypothetical protein [Candidatus Didemnitutus sp.]